MSTEKQQENKKAPSAIERLKNQFHGLKVAHGRFDNKTIGTDYFIVQEADGLLFVKDMNNSFETVHTIKWNEMPDSLFLDRLFLKAFYFYDKEETSRAFTISRTNDGDAICKEIEKRKTVELKQRKAYQRIVGFRSGFAWKSVIAIGAYALMLFLVIGLFTAEDEKAIANPGTIQKEKGELIKNKEVSTESSKKKSGSEKTKKDSVKTLYKKLGNNYIFKTQKVDKNFSALNDANHTITLRVKPIGGSADQIHSQAKHLAASILKEALDKDKKLDQLALFVDNENGIFIVKYVFDKDSLNAINDSRTSDGYVLKDNIEKLASLVTLSEELR